MNLLLAKQKGLEKIVGELEWELRQKSKEVDEGMELQNKLLQLVQSKTSVIMNKGKQLKECEEKTNVLLAKLNCLEKKVDELEEKLRGKTIEVAKGKELQEDLIKKFELQASEIKNSEQSLIDHEEEKKLLTANLERLEENVDGLQKELRKKTEEVEEERKLQEKLIQQV
ncbi:hypothetical protein L1049_011069 [Liquidambar formosana]|uniref:Uncharacterized protein n=1 Tax=Liquidambar formosana TaxID=63359 RepID=A0AAP0RQX8_LIQFO